MTRFMIPRYSGSCGTLVRHAGYLRAMGLAIVKGRDLQLLDGEGEITGVVVNRKMVEKAWPNRIRSAS